MPTTTRLPTGAGFYNAVWAPAGSASNWQAVQPPDDDATTYTENGAATQDPLTFVSSTTLPSTAAFVVSHILTGRAFNVDAALANEVFFVRLSGSDQAGSLITGVTGAWTTGTQSDIARPGGGTWSVADVNAAEFGTKKSGANVSAVRLTTMQWAITWRVTSGGLVFLLLSLGPLVAVTLGELPGLARAVYRKTRTRLLPDEYRQAWRELREYRFPRYYDLGSRP